MKTYDPKNWYWIVGGDETRAFSSATGNYVAAANAGYVEWLADGTSPTRIASEAELGEVLSQYMIRPTAANVLDGYKESHASKLTLELAFKLLFNHENRLRACERALALNGSPADLTAGQAKAAMKALM